MIEYRFATSADLDELIDFINMVFSMLRVPHDFTALLPKVYGHVHRLADIHAIALENGRICGCVGTYVYPLHVGNEVLRVGYVGSVSVHRRVRGMGVMRRLMEMNIERARAEKLDMMVLGGQRQRYEYYGFTPCGATYEYSISAANVRHALENLNTEDVLIRPMTEDDAAYACACYNAQTVSGARTEKNFLDTAASYGNEPWMILKNEKPAGYLIASADHKRVCELVMDAPEWRLSAVKKWMEQQPIRLVQLSAAPYDVSLNQALAPICEGFSLNENSMLLCLNFEKVVRAYMHLKQMEQPLCSGTFCMDSADWGTLKMTVDDGQISVENTGTAEVCLNMIDAQQLLFGYNPFTLPEVRKKVPAGWFPLPFHIPEPDTF